MGSTSTTGREELAAILDIAAQQDGPIRLFQPRDPSIRPKRPGLFPSSKGKHGEFIEELVGTMLEEVLAQPRMVKLTRFGIETLLRNTPQSERNALISRSSTLYREELINTWNRFATKGEQSQLKSAVEQCFGKWFPATQNQANLEEFRELLAQEVADSWSESESAEAKMRLAHLLKILGAVPLGKEKEVVAFTGLQHNPLEPLFKGDPAQITRPGWTFPKSPTPLLLVKAEVRATKK